MPPQSANTAKGNVPAAPRQMPSGQMLDGGQGVTDGVPAIAAALDRLLVA